MVSPVEAMEAMDISPIGDLSKTREIQGLFVVDDWMNIYLPSIGWASNHVKTHVAVSLDP